MHADRFVIFVRADRHPWSFGSFSNDFGDAKRAAHEAVNGGVFDRAQVFEVSGVDAVPMFTFCYLVKK